MDVSQPLCIILVKNGSKGDKLLFRYPYDVEAKTDPTSKSQRSNPYSIAVADDLQLHKPHLPSSADSSNLSGVSDAVLSDLFAPRKTELCDQKFELKVNDVRFVCHPTLLQPKPPLQNTTGHNGSLGSKRNYQSTLIMFSIVFALQANASHSVVDCYHELSKCLAVAIRHEERRCYYLTNEAKIMLAAHDEVSAQPEGCKESPFSIILTKTRLGKDMKRIYDDLCSTGVVNLAVNGWVKVNYTIPQILHAKQDKDLLMEPAILRICFEKLRPYHAVLLLVSEKELLNCLPIDSSPALIRLIKMATPLKSLQHVAADADITLAHVFQLVGHLVYWAKAIVIYPLCESNVYVLAPMASTHVGSSLVDKFAEKFHGCSLLAVLADFSLPTSLSQHGSPLSLPQQQTQQVHMVIWMLQHRLLLQLHTYVYLMASGEGLNHSSQSPDAASNELNDCKLPLSHELDINNTNYNGLRQQTDSEVTSLKSDDYGSSPSLSRSEGGMMAMSPDNPAGLKSMMSFLEQQEEEDDEDCVEHSLLSELERDCVLTIPAAKNQDDLKLFYRLCPYFRGQHHLEEMMYHENVRRSQLLTMLDKFRSVLLTCQHEDPAIAVFYPHRKGRQFVDSS